MSAQTYFRLCLFVPLILPLPFLVFKGDEGLSSMVVEPAVDRDAYLVALDDALTELASFDTQLSRVIELRFFGGLGVDETAHVLGVAPVTVKRMWKFAKGWLHREITKGP